MTDYVNHDRPCRCNDLQATNEGDAKVEAGQAGGGRPARDHSGDPTGVDGGPIGISNRADKTRGLTAVVRQWVREDLEWRDRAALDRAEDEADYAKA